MAQSTESERQRCRDYDGIAPEFWDYWDYLFCATSTCGTLRGCAEYTRKYNLSTKLYVVDAVGSVIFGGKVAKRIIPRHGATVRPTLYQDDLAYDCVQGCRRLAIREAILAGGSSGAVLIAVEQVKKRILPGANCVMILADRGDRYLDSIYSDEWVCAHFGEIKHLWENLSHGHYA